MTTLWLGRSDDVAFGTLRALILAGERFLDALRNRLSDPGCLLEILGHDPVDGEGEVVDVRERSLVGDFHARQPSVSYPVGTLGSMQVTLDTDVLLEYWKDHAKKALVEQLLALAKEKDIDLAITARVREDIPDEPLASKINALLDDIGVEETGSVTRLDYWVLGRDMWGSEEFEAFRLQLESDRKEGDPTLPDWRDWDHLHAHMLLKRTVFLTWDKPILWLSEVLEDRFGIRVQTPDDFLAAIATPPAPAPDPIDSALA